jgi:DNA repair photolyase
MYDWIGETWNPLGGACPHKCSYCYVRRSRIGGLPKYKGELRLDERAMKKSLGKGKTWFVCSCNDLFADAVSDEIIEQIIFKCHEYPENAYVFQTKNPIRLERSDFPQKSILGITLETNRKIEHSFAPQPLLRLLMFDFVKWCTLELLRPDIKFFVTVEPIMDFDLEDLVGFLDLIHPDFVNIGADSKHCHLPEPSGEKVESLIAELGKFTEVRLKKNLERILKGGAR